MPCTVHLQIFPRVWPASSYATCHIQRAAYSNYQEIRPEPLDGCQLDYDKANGRPFEYLLGPFSNGPLSSATRGKQLVVACGNVRLLHLHWHLTDLIVARRHCLVRLGSSHHGYD